mmetsp:Transcript_18123/g.44470  ORF Transcript_18123/g.44470 Transcript_18123/m.44470 type:complete len:209 (-) Transcript_18123:116-742(-)
MLDALEGVVVHVVLDGARRDLGLEALSDGGLELLANLHDSRLLLCVACPHRDPVPGLAQADHGPAQLVPGVEVLADESERGVQPHVVDDLLAILLGNAVRPLASKLVRGVLPHRLDASLEEVVVGAGIEARGRADIVEDPPEVLHHVKRRHLLQVRAPVLGPQPLHRIVEPEDPLVLEGVGDPVADGHGLLLGGHLRLRRGRHLRHAS